MRRFLRYGLISVLTVVLAGCGWAQEEEDPEAPVPDAAQGVADSTELTEAQHALLALVPRNGEADLPEGLTLSAEPALYTKDYLADYIDGDAESFYPHGVGDTVATIYAAGEGARVELDLYDMTTDLGAFGVYGHRRPEAIEPLEIGTQGYITGRQVVFLAGRYYGVARVISRKPETLDLGRALAEAIAKRIPEPHAFPSELAYFPEENAVAHSADYFPIEYLALTDMPPVYVHAYATAGEPPTRYRVAFSPVYGDEDQAAMAFAPMADALKARTLEGTLEEGTVTLGELRCASQTGDLKYRGAYLALLNGRRIVLVVGLPRAEALEAAGHLVERLPVPE
jgi:hypothetical protein